MTDSRPRPPWACPSCGAKHHLMVYKESRRRFVRFMPPKFCPSCGARQEEEK